MLKLLTCQKLSARTKAFRHGSTTRPLMATSAINQGSRFLQLPVLISAFQTSAARDKNPGWPPLEEQNDGGQHGDFTHDGPQPGLQNLIRHADAERCGGGSDQVSNPAEDHDHETVHNIILAQARTDIADLGKTGAGHAGQTRTESKRHHVDAISANAQSGGHGAVLHHSTNLQPECGARQQPIGEQEDEDGKTDYENAIIRQQHIFDNETAAQPTRRADLDVGRAERIPENLLPNEAYSPGRQQRFERTI